MSDDATEKKKPAGCSCTGYKVYLFAAFVDILGLTCATPVLPFICADLGVRVQDVGLVFTAFTVGFMISALFTGWLSDKVGCKISCLVMTAGSVIGFLITALASTVAVFVIGRVVGGLFCGSPTIAQTFASSYTNADAKAQAYLYYSQACLLGLLGGSIAAALAQWHIRAPFYLLAGLSTIACIVCALRGVNPPAASPPQRSAADGSDATPESATAAAPAEAPASAPAPAGELAPKVEGAAAGAPSKMKAALLLAHIMGVICLTEAASTAQDLALTIILIDFHSWQPFEISIYSLAVAVCGVLALLFVIMPANGKFGIKFVAAAANVLSLGAAVLQCFLGGTDLSLDLTLAICFHVLMVLYRPSLDAGLQARLSACVPPHRQGLIMGAREVALNLARSVALPFATLLITPTFVAAPMVMSACLRGIAFVGALVLVGLPIPPKKTPAAAEAPDSATTPAEAAAPAPAQEEGKAGPEIHGFL